MENEDNTMNDRGNRISRSKTIYVMQRKNFFVIIIIHEKIKKFSHHTPLNFLRKIFSFIMLIKIYLR